MDKRNIELLLRKAYPFISEQIDPKTISKIIPLAFPVIQSSWQIKVDTVEPAGLIDRYILRVLKDFGPCTLKQIDELLCLGEERIEHALIDMEKLGSPIGHTSGSCYSFAADGDIDHFHIVQEHEFAFCINGVTGGLLPVDFCKKAKNAEISDIQEERPLYVKLLPIVSGAESELMSCRQGIDATKVKEGIPDGFLSLSERAPRFETCRYFLSFMIVDINKIISFFCAGNKPYALNVPQNYMRELPEAARILERKDSLEIPLDGISATQKDTTIYIAVKDQNLWDCFETDETPDQSIFFMRSFIRNGWLWDISGWKFSHYILQPANKITARALFISRASFKMEHDYPTLETREDAESWLQEFFKNFGCDELSCPSLNDVLKKMLNSPNSEVRDFVRAMTVPEHRRNLHVNAEEYFYASTESNWRTNITSWLMRARNSIKIISPVIESDTIFEELEEANRRGVYLQIITSLFDKNGKIKTTDDKQFSSLKLPRQRLASLGASVHATQNTPHAKLIIIDKSIVLFMSANLNDNSLGVGNANALETCIILREPTAVEHFVQMFDKIWNSAQFIQGADKDSIFVVQTAGSPISDIPCRLEGKNETLIFSCPQNLALEKEIVEIIKGAKKDVILMAMSFYDMDQVTELYRVLLELLKHKISVTLLVRTGAEQFSESEWPDESTKALQQAGMRLVEVPHLHAKGVIVDGKTVLAMSANFNPYSLGNKPTSHIECGLLAVSETSWSKQFVSFILGLINK